MIMLCFAVCLDCAVDWGEWQACKGGSRIRTQYVASEAQGAGEPCPEILQSETEGM